MTEETLRFLSRAQRGLRSRFEDFRGALERRDEAAFRLGLAEFQERLARWTDAEERILLPALSRTSLPGRDPVRELRLEYVQLRELTRYVRMQIESRAAVGDTLGYVENLSRRFDAHESEVLSVYYPAAAAALTEEERRALERDAPPE